MEVPRTDIRLLPMSARVRKRKARISPMNYSTRVRLRLRQA